MYKNCLQKISTWFIEYILRNSAHQLEKHDFKKKALKVLERRAEKLDLGVFEEL